MISQNIENLLVKPVVVGSIGAVSSMYFYPDTSVIVGNSRMSLSKLAFIGITIGSIVSELLHEFAFPSIPRVGSILSNPATEAISIASVLGTNVLLHYMANARSVAEIGITTLLIESAGAEIAGDYLTRQFIVPLLNTVF